METTQLSSKLIRLIINMIIPFYTFLKKNKRLIEGLENERAEFYYLMHRHSEITKKAMQFEQALKNFPSLIEHLQVTGNKAEEREQELAQQALSAPSPGNVDFNKPISSPRRRPTLSLDLF